MAGFGDRFFGFIQHRGVVLAAYLLYAAGRAAQYWLDPTQPEDARLAATMALGVYALLSIFAWRRNTLAVWLMSAAMLFTGLASFLKAIGLSMTDPLNTIGLNAFSILAGAYFLLGAVVVFRSRRIKIVGIEVVEQAPDQTPAGPGPADPQGPGAQ